MTKQLYLPSGHQFRLDDKSSDGKQAVKKQLQTTQ